MNPYWFYWRRGWWAFLMICCVNLGVLVVCLPLSYMFAGMPAMSLLAGLIAYLVVGSPWTGIVFERFAGKARIGDARRLAAGGGRSNPPMRTADTTAQFGQRTEGKEASMNTRNIRSLERSLTGGGNDPARIDALSRVLVDLLVEVEALRDALLRSSPGARGHGVHDGYDGPCHDRTLTEDKPAYPAAYVHAAYILHNSAGPSSGLDKLLGRFYPAEWDSPDTMRESLMLRRLGFSDGDIARFRTAAEQAELFT